jgi:hypothetical protein
MLKDFPPSFLEASFFLQVGLLVGWEVVILYARGFSSKLFGGKIFSPSRIMGWVGGGDTIC